MTIHFLPLTVFPRHCDPSATSEALPVAQAAHELSPTEVPGTNPDPTLQIVADEYGWHPPVLRSEEYVPPNPSFLGPV